MCGLAQAHPLAVKATKARHRSRAFELHLLLHYIKSGRGICRYKEIYKLNDWSDLDMICTFYGLDKIFKIPGTMV